MLPAIRIQGTVHLRANSAVAASGDEAELLALYRPEASEAQKAKLSPRKMKSITASSFEVRRVRSQLHSMATSAHVLRSDLLRFAAATSHLDRSWTEMSCNMSAGVSKASFCSASVVGAVSSCKKGIADVYDPLARLESAHAAFRHSPITGDCESSRFPRSID